MDVTKKNVEQICAPLRQYCEREMPHLKFIFVLYSSGEEDDTITLMESRLKIHSAGEYAVGLLKEKITRHHNGFLGFALNEKKKFLGLAKEESGIALFAFNLSNYETIDHIKSSILHHIWHALDFYRIRSALTAREKLRTGPISPKRSPLNLARANLQADAFAACFMTSQGKKDSLESIARLRAERALKADKRIQVEHYPIVSAYEAAEYGISKAPKIKQDMERLFRRSCKLSNDISAILDEEIIEQWWSFCKPAQDMAWRGIPADQILSAALYTSDDPFVRATAYLVAELLGVEEQDDAEDIQRIYNAFKSDTYNKQIHNEMADEIFEEVISIGVQENSGRPILNAANLQNQRLTEGQTIGWSAYALQTAAKAFDQAIIHGRSPEQAAKMEYQGNKNITSWENLQRLGHEVIQQKKEGFGTTLDDISKMSEGKKEFETIFKSIQTTIIDPEFGQNLDHGQKLSMDKTYERKFDFGLSLEQDVDMELVSSPTASAPAPGLGGGGEMLPSYAEDSGDLELMDDDDVYQKESESSGKSEKSSS